MKRLATSTHFQKQLKKLTATHQREIISTLKDFRRFLGEGKIPAGYGFKKTGQGQYELRIDLKTRILMENEKTAFVCHFIGNHDEVENYLKNT